MKPIYSTLILCTTLIFAGCSKSDSNTTPYFSEEDQEFAYKAESVADTSIEQSANSIMILQYKKISGVTEDVQLSISGLPAGVTATLDPEVAKPPFNTVLHIKTNRAALGTYPITITGWSKKTGGATNKFNLNITPYSNAATGLAGEYTNAGSCTPQTGELNHNAKVEIATTANNRIKILALWSTSWDNELIADLNTTNKTLTIAEQVSNNLTFSGSGTYTDNTITINYTVKGLTMNETCSVVFTRK